jgi:hypothetical protein
MPTDAINSDLAAALSATGEKRTLKMNEAFLIGDPDHLWFIGSGQIELFVVQTDGNELVGARSHFATFNPGSIIFGMDFELYGQSSGFLATSSDRTQIYKIPRDKLRLLAREREYTLGIGELSFGRRSKEIALREIASVLDESAVSKNGAALGDDLTDQTFAVCKLIGEASGIQIVAPPDLRRLKQRLPAIAKASRFRFRSVALRDNWWETDHGPLLAYREQGLAPVAILKNKATDYELVDPETNERRSIDASVAATLCPFAVSFYTPFPEKKLRAWDLI